MPEEDSVKLGLGLAAPPPFGLALKLMAAVCAADEVAAELINERVLLSKLCTPEDPEPLKLCISSLTNLLTVASKLSFSSLSAMMKESHGSDSCAQGMRTKC